jgi:hypothetical protein
VSRLSAKELRDRGVPDEIAAYWLGDRHEHVGQLKDVVVEFGGPLPPDLEGKRRALREKVAAARSHFPRHR